METLPPEVLQRVLGFLGDVRWLCAASATSQQMRRAAGDNHLWREAFEARRPLARLADSQHRRPEQFPADCWQFLHARLVLAMAHRKGVHPSKLCHNPHHYVRPVREYRRRPRSLRAWVCKHETARRSGRRGRVHRTALATRREQEEAMPALLDELKSRPWLLPGLQERLYRDKRRAFFNRIEYRPPPLANRYAAERYAILHSLPLPE